MSAVEYAYLLLALGLLLAAARLFGEIAERFGQPTVLGEICAGVLLGPTVLGRVAPDIHAALFPLTGTRATVAEGLFLLAIVLFMLVAGMEVDLSTVWRQGKNAAAAGIAGVLVPFALGFVAAWFAPDFLGHALGAPLHIFALFIATALAISALPVIAKTLMDLGLYHSDLGMVVIAAAIFSDIVGWILFAVILGMMDVDPSHQLGIGFTVALVFGYAAFMLTAVRWAFNRVLPWVKAHSSFPGGVLGLALAIALAGAAFTEWAGVHAIFGAFLAGVAIGDSPHLRNHTRAIMHQFIAFFFAPLFFASIGLKVDFAANFEPVLVIVMVALACLGKIAPCAVAGIWSGMPRREAWAAGFALNARGAMEIILGLLALRFGVIAEPVFVALVVMALVTSMLSGVAIPAVLRRAKRRRLDDYLSNKTFAGTLKAGDMQSAIAELAQTMSRATGLPAARLADAVWYREQTASTALGNGVAVPHARLSDINGFAVGAAVSPKGIDFNAPDGRPAHVVFFLVSPEDDDGAQLEILADIADRFADADFSERIAEAGNYTEFLAALKTRGQ